jgi:hypothetical protein
MPKTGKRFEWEVGLASHNPLSAVFQDYDWADEVLHARIGRDWYLKEFDDAKKAVQYGDECWSKVLMGWEQWREQGLTQHRNWWPEAYTEACARWGQKRIPESDAALAELIAKTSETAAYQVAEAYAYRNDRDKAFEWLERARQQHDAGMPGLRPDTLLTNLHDDPRWDALLHAVGLANDQLK